MSKGIRRRTVVCGTATGALAWAGGLAFNGCANDQNGSNFFRFVKTWPAPHAAARQGGLEAAATWIESTPREKIFERWAQAVRAGESPELLFRALFLASIRTLQPFPGGVFHVAMMWASANALTRTLGDEQRLVAQLFLLDHFKEGQEEKLGVIPLEPAAPSTSQDLGAELDGAYDRWEVSAAEAVLMRLYRDGGRNAVLPILLHNALRDIGHIGHAAIAARQLALALDQVGWQEAEPALRAFVRMQFFVGEAGHKPEDARLASWAQNRERARALAAIPDGPTSDAVTLELLSAFRELTIDAGVSEVDRRLMQGLPAATVWDALCVFSGEMLLQETGRGKTDHVHLATHANAARGIAETLVSAEHKAHVLLQAVATTLATRDEARRRVGHPALTAIDRLERDPGVVSSAEEIFEGLASAASAEAPYRTQLRAVRRALAFLADGGAPESMMAAATTMVVTKGREAHWYKFPAAAFEDYAKMRSSLRGRVLAASAIYLPGTADADWKRLAEAKAILAGL